MSNVLTCQRELEHIHTHRTNLTEVEIYKYIFIIYSCSCQIFLSAHIMVYMLFVVKLNNFFNLDSHNVCIFCLESQKGCKTYQNQPEKDVTCNTYVM